MSWSYVGRPHTNGALSWQRLLATTASVASHRKPDFIWQTSPMVHRPQSVHEMHGNHCNRFLGPVSRHQFCPCDGCLDCLRLVNMQVSPDVTGTLRCALLLLDVFCEINLPVILGNLWFLFPKNGSTHWLFLRPENDCPETETLTYGPADLGLVNIVATLMSCHAFISGTFGAFDFFFLQNGLEEMSEA